MKINFGNVLSPFSPFALPLQCSDMPSSAFIIPSTAGGDGAGGASQHNVRGGAAALPVEPVEGRRTTTLAAAQGASSSPVCQV